MTPKEQANKIANSFVTKSVFEMNNVELQEQRALAKKHSVNCVDKIIDALKITTGHLELRKLDQQEVEKDFAFWKTVKKEIELL